jgi:hypothetical protein
MPIFFKAVEVIYCFSIQKLTFNGNIIKKCLGYSLRKSVRDIHPPHFFNDGIFSIPHL